jgi:hypothetical protein
MKAKANSGNCVINMNQIRVAGVMRNDCLTPLIAILGSNTSWGTDICLNYSVFILSCVDRQRMRLANPLFHRVVTNTFKYKSNKNLYHLQKLLKICKTNHENLTKVLCDIGLTVPKFGKLFKQIRREMKRMERIAAVLQCFT